MGVVQVEYLIVVQPTVAQIAPLENSIHSKMPQVATFARKDITIRCPEQINPETLATNVDWVGMEVLNKLQTHPMGVPIARQVGTKT